jgi:LysM repeat protein
MDHQSNKKATFATARTLSVLASLAAAWAVTPVLAQSHYPVTPSQQSTARQVAQNGVPLSELATNAPDTYVVKRGDTLWGISGMYLQRPWRWPELWGMNLQSIANPHLIYPGQTLYLDKSNGMARLSTSRPGSSEPPVVHASPRSRTESLADLALPTLKPHLIEPFLVEPVVVDADTLQKAPRIVATSEERVLMASGDRAYVRGDASSPLLREPGEPRRFQVYRDAVALKDPITGAILGYEAQYLGRAELIRGEGLEEASNGKGGVTSEYIPATVTLSRVKEEIRAGDRLLPTPARAFASYVPHAPQTEVEARVVSIYGGTPVSYAAQNQVVAINLGTADGVEAGQVLHLLTKGDRIRDNTDPDRATIKLPSERNGMAMVFRTFDRVSYVLILETQHGVRVGDRLVNPR